MTWLLWRQHRAQTLVAAASLAVLVVMLVPTGIHMADIYRSSRACTGVLCGPPPFDSYRVFQNLVTLTVAVPLLLGLFWGAPLVARELESGTHAVVWTQSVSRTRWIVAKFGTTLVMAALWGGAVAAVVSWWSGTLNSLNGSRFLPAHFDTQGIVPVAYTLFAVGLGIAAGTLVKRTLPAIGLTVLGFAALRIVTDNYLRPNFLQALHLTQPLSKGPETTVSGWIIRNDLTLNGRVLTGNVRVPGCAQADSRSTMNQCLDQAGYRISITYQPSDRWWTFQLIESGIYLGLAAILVTIAVIVLRRRDA